MEKINVRTHRPYDWRWLAKLPDAPGLEAFDEVPGVEAMPRYEDCDRYLHWGPYALWHVRSLAEGEPCPRTAAIQVTVRGFEETGEETPFYGRRRQAGWYATADFCIAGVDPWYGDDIRDTYTVARAMPTEGDALRELGAWVPRLRELGIVLPTLGRGAGGDPACFLRATDVDGTFTEREVSPWGLCRAALLFDVDPEMLAAFMERRPARAAFAVEYSLDLVDQGFFSQDDLVGSFCEEVYSAADGDAARLAYEMEVRAR